MELILALLGFGFLTVLWSRQGRQRRDLDEWRSTLWGVQRAGANLEQRVVTIEARGAPQPWAQATWGGSTAALAQAEAWEALSGSELAAVPSMVQQAIGAHGPAALARERLARDLPDESADSSGNDVPTETVASNDTALGESALREAHGADANAPAANTAAPSEPAQDALDVGEAVTAAPLRDEATEDEATEDEPSHDGGLADPVAKPISLEQWLGVRGAAALGAAVLVLAGVYFFKYSIENELLTTTMRVALGAFTAMGLAVGSELWLRRRHEVLANWLTGAAMAIFYVTFWAAFARYELIGAPVAGALMIIVTAASCAMSIKRSSLAIASLGLVGGFATPMMLSTGSDRPFLLFGYLFLLDVGLLLVAYKRRWPGLALLSLIGTSGYQALWIVARMGPERLGTGMVLCGIFAVMFSFAGERRQASDARAVDELWGLTRAASLALPVGFALYLSADLDMSASFVHVAMLLAGGLIGAAVVARQERWSRLLKAILLPTLAVLGTWLFTRGLDDAWLVGGFCVAAAALLQTLVESDVDTTANIAEGCGGWIYGSFAITICAVACTPGFESPWPWMATWLGLALVALRHGSTAGRQSAVLGGAVALGIGLITLGVHHLVDATTTQAEVFIGMAVGVVVVYQLATLLLSYQDARKTSGHAAAVLPVVLLLVLPGAVAMRPGLYAFASLVLLALVAFATLRNASSSWLIAGTGLAGIAQSWPWQLADQDVMMAPWGGPTTAAHHVALVAHAAAAVMVCVWPLLANDRVRNATATWRAAALAPVIMFLPMVMIHRRLFGQTSTAVLALALGTLTIGTLMAARKRGIADATVRHSASTWMGATSLGFATVAIPLALEYEWVTIGWALLATALLALWRRVDHAGLKYVAFALNVVVFVRLLFIFDVAGYHGTVGLPVLNWLTYTYLVPVGCLVANIALLHGVEDGRLRTWEPTSGHGGGITRVLYGAAAIIIGFIWINVTIVDAFSVGSQLDLNIERMPARDLTMSISWACYGLALLAAGMWRNMGALRKASLALILITCGKVFLFDLAHLQDLYRVMSLTGLALSLIAVSVAYNRFVTTRPEELA